jgi:hypothetical protein
VIAFIVLVCSAFVARVVWLEKDNTLTSQTALAQEPRTTSSQAAQPQPQFKSGDIIHLTMGQRYGVTMDGEDQVLVAVDWAALARMMELCDAGDMVGLNQMWFPDYQAFPMAPGTEGRVIGDYYFYPEKIHTGQKEFFYEVRFGKGARTFWVHESNLQR